LHDELDVHLVQRLAEIDPVVAVRAGRVARDVVAADEFHFTFWHQIMRVAGRDHIIVVHIEAVLGPGTGLVNDVQQRQMAGGAIGEVDFVQG
jgi:hypothetical protein